MSDPSPEPLEPWTYARQNICDNTLDDAQLETRCPLDQTTVPPSDAPRRPAGRLDRLPVELLVQVLLYVDLPSLTGFRRVSRRARDLVDAVPQYAAVVEHCPNIIRAILSIQAAAYDCRALFATLCTSRCATCERFGDHLYLIDCRRVCYLCFIVRPEYFPLTIGRASSFYARDAPRKPKPPTGRQLLCAADPPNILSLPGQYCTAWARGGGNLSRKRRRLFDRKAVVRDLAASVPPELDKTTREPLRFMAIITAPYLAEAGRRADWGRFCLGCRDETDEKTKYFRIKFTREEILEHMERYGPVKEWPDVPGKFMHTPRVE